MSVQNNSDYCCGLHAVCEKRSWREAATADLYFDDEELDNFRGRDAEDYTEDEIEQFRDVLYTMRKEEILDWLDCLEKRKITPPMELEPECQLLLSDLVEAN